MRALIEFVARALVDDPAAVRVQERRSEAAVVYELSVARDDVGKVDTVLNFTRLAWNPTLADAVRRNEVTSTEGADMQVYVPDFEQNRVEYKYFAPDSCELVEQCIGAPGWRSPPSTKTEKR